MKFENPTINISMFDMEEVITTSADPTPSLTDEQAANKLADTREAAAILTFTF